MVLWLKLLFFHFVITRSFDDGSSMVQLATLPAQGNNAGAEVFASTMIQLKKNIASRDKDPYGEDPSNLIALVLYAVQLTGHLFMFCPWLDFIMWTAVGIPAYAKQLVHDDSLKDEHERENYTTIDGVAEAFNVLTQQMTTIGYGTTVANSDSKVNMAVHSLGSLIAQLGLGSWWKNIVNLVFDATQCPYKMVCAFGEFVAAFVTNIIMFALDCPWFSKDGCGLHDMDWMRALYAVVISMTTVGYGDIAPNHNLHKVMSFVTQPWLGSSFDELNEQYPLWLFNKTDRSDMTPRGLFSWVGNQVDNDDDDPDPIETHAESLRETSKKVASYLTPTKISDWAADIKNKMKKNRPENSDAIPDTPVGEKKLKKGNAFFNLDFKKLRVCKRVTRSERPDPNTEDSPGFERV